MMMVEIGLECGDSMRTLLIDRSNSLIVDALVLFV